MRRSTSTSAATGPAYVERDHLTPEEVVDHDPRRRRTRDAGPPGRELNGEGVLEMLLERLTPAGLTGMEVYYQDYAEGEVERLRRIAETFEPDSPGR